MEEKNNENLNFDKKIDVDMNLETPSIEDSVANNRIAQNESTNEFNGKTLVVEKNNKKTKNTKGKELLLRIRNKVTTAYIAKIAILSAVSFVLYMFAKFNLPFMFPSFLEIQFSELPALLAGFSMGPVAGGLVILIKCLLKFPFSHTVFVGEIMDIILGLFYVLPASIIYYRKKTKKNAIVGLLVGTACATVMSMIFNRFVAIPFYVQVFFGSNFDALIATVKPIYPTVNRANFYNFYIFVGVLPFNILRLGVVSVITFFVYKHLSKLLHWEIHTKKQPKEKENSSKNVILNENSEIVSEIATKESVAKEEFTENNKKS